MREPTPKAERTMEGAVPSAPRTRPGKAHAGRRWNGALHYVIAAALSLLTTDTKAQDYRIGSVRGCIRAPQFVQKHGIRTPLFSTTHRSIPGLILQDGTRPNAPVIQEATWQMAGRLGPLAFDGAGNIYTAPVPHVNVLSTALSKQNTIYQVRSADGVMQELITLPATAQPSNSNPYGITGLSYDCETQVLYASTLSGSTATQQLGIVYAVSIPERKVIAELKGTDILGLSPFNAKRGKVLLLGSARRSELLQVGLDQSGKFIGAPSKLLQFDLFNLTKARKITVDKQLVMSVESTEFNYNLIASTELMQKTYRYRYMPEEDRWLSLK